MSFYSLLIEYLKLSDEELIGIYDFIIYQGTTNLYKNGENLILKYNEQDIMDSKELVAFILLNRNSFFEKIDFLEYQLHKTIKIEDAIFEEILSFAGLINYGLMKEYINNEKIEKCYNFVKKYDRLDSFEERKRVLL